MLRSVVLLGTSSLWFTSAGQAQAPIADGELVVAAVDGNAATLPDAETETALDHDLRLSGVTSDVDGGIATLEGIVASEAEKTRAEELARHAPGVTHVRSRIIVSGDVSTTVHAGAPLPPAVDAAVLARIGADPLLAGREIDVRADERNAVTLTGEVASEPEKMHAGRVAAETPSVTEVRNRLEVRPQ